MYKKEVYDLVESLGKELKKMYDTAEEGEQVTRIHLFGIKNGEKIINNRIKVSDIVQFAEINEFYKTEVRKGVKLSKYVFVKQGIL